MKNHETEKPGSGYRNDGVLFCRNHPEMDLNPGSFDAADIHGLRATGNDAPSEYALDTAAWD